MPQGSAARAAHIPRTRRPPAAAERIRSSARTPRRTARPQKTATTIPCPAIPMPRTARTASTAARAAAETERPTAPPTSTEEALRMPTETPGRRARIRPQPTPGATTQVRPACGEALRSKEPIPTGIGPAPSKPFRARAQAAARQSVQTAMSASTTPTIPMHGAIAARPGPVITLTARRMPSPTAAPAATAAMPPLPRKPQNTVRAARAAMAAEARAARPRRARSSGCSMSHWTLSARSAGSSAHSSPLTPSVTVSRLPG